MSDSITSHELIFISGSFARGEARRKGSDIDLVWVTQNAGYVYSESFTVGNVRIQITVMPAYKLTDVIASDVVSSDRIYINLLEECVPTDENGETILAEIKEYIGYMKSQSDRVQDIHVFWQMAHIKELCFEISNEGNNSVVIAADLFRTLMAFVTGLPNTTSKYVGRAMNGNCTAEKICAEYTESVAKKDYSGFVTTAMSVVGSYIGSDMESSTGISYNMPPKSCLTVFIPGRKSRKPSFQSLMTKFGLCCMDVPFYTFYVGNNQFMECGTYLHVRGNGRVSSEELMDRFYDCHKKLAGICISKDIKVIFPYRTSFDTGYRFGGKTIFNMLYPIFCKIYNLSSNCKAPGIALGITMCNILKTKRADGLSMLKKYMDSLALDTVDPNCVYNVVQSMYMREALREYYDNTDEVELPPVDVSVFDALSTYVDVIFNTMQGIDENEIHIVKTLFPDSKKVTVLLNTIDHILSIFSLDTDEKYAIVHYCLKRVNK